MDLIIFIFLLITPGFVALAVYNLISRTKNGILTGLIFDLFIFILAIIGLYYLKGILTVTVLQQYYNRTGFIWKYATLAILAGLPLAIFSGVISRIFKKKKLH